MGSYLTRPSILSVIEDVISEKKIEEFEKSGKLATVIQPWIDKRIESYLGQGDATLTSFVCDLLKARTDRSACREQLLPIFDKDVESFVSDLFQEVDRCTAVA